MDGAHEYLVNISAASCQSSPGAGCRDARRELSARFDFLSTPAAKLPRTGMMARLCALSKRAENGHTFARAVVPHGLRWACAIEGHE